jgi:ABC-type spermidine/putrescine transport system permease subunit I
MTIEPNGPWFRVSGALWRRPWARATMLLTPPLAWFVLLYLAALVVLLITAFWQINPFTTNIERAWSLDNLSTIFTSSAYLRIIGRTVGMAAAVTAVLERIPGSQLEASQDLGARTWRTTRLVLLPLALPGIVAGSIFTFSLTLGDYITPLLVGGTSATFMGNIIYSNIGIANNVPFAAAMALVPIAIMAVYLLSARALGAFEAV